MGRVTGEKETLRILVVSGSPRKNGNSEHLAQAFCEGARKAGHTASVYCLSQYKVNPCLGCGSCHKNGGQCVQKDGMEEILKEFDQADMLVLASPVYFFSVSAQMKAFIDRLYSRITRPMKVKQCALLLTAGGDAGFAPIDSMYQVLKGAMQWESVLTETYCGDIPGEALEALTEKVFGRLK